MNSIKSILLTSITIFIGIISFTQTNLPQQQDRWNIQPDGSILWTINDRLPHSDHIEMSGQKVSLWIQYGVDSAARPSLVRTIVFPSFRLLPNLTTAAMM